MHSQTTVHIARRSHNQPAAGAALRWRHPRHILHSHRTQHHTQLPIHNPSPRPALALTDAVDALRLGNATGEQIVRVLNARIISDSDLASVTAALGKVLADATAAARDSAEPGARRGAERDLAAAKQIVGLHAVQKTDIAALRVAAGTAQG